MAVFIGIFVLVAGGGLAYDYSRPAIYRAMARLSVEPPGSVEDPAVKSQFAISEAQAMRRSELMQAVLDRVQTASTAGLDLAALDRILTAEAVPQTSLIELHGEGPDRALLVAGLSAWIDAYSASRKETDRNDETESVEDARHSVRVALKAVEEKRREMESYRQRHGILSTERDENPSAARLKGLHTALNDAATKEVNAEARLNAVNESIGQGKGVVRAADKTALSNLEMRAVDLRDKLKELEHDFTPQYLALDPKFKALKANLSRVEQQLEQEKDRGQKAALIEAQEEFAGARRAAGKIREQAESLKQESQNFSTRFVELKRMASDLEQLQEARRLAAERLAKLESARKPSAVKIRIMTSPTASADPVSPDYSRDAGVALGAGLIFAIAAVWLTDYLRRDPERQPEQQPQPIIQIAYPMIGQQSGVPPAMLPFSQPTLPSLALAANTASELAAEDVSALWRNASADGRLMVAALFAGIAPAELSHLRWKHVDLVNGTIDVPGPSARRITVLDPMRQELAAKAAGSTMAETPLLADGAGNPLDEAAMNGQLACMAHDAGLKHPHDITGEALHFTYAAFLARQGIRMSDLAATVGRLTGAVGAELIRLAPPGRVRPVEQVELLYPAFRLA